MAAALCLGGDFVHYLSNMLASFGPMLRKRPLGQFAPWTGLIRTPNVGLLVGHSPALVFDGLVSESGNSRLGKLRTAGGTAYLNEKLGLDEAEAERNSPLRNLPRRGAPLLIAYGTAELPELQRQSIEFGEAWAHAALPGELVPVAGANHFTVVEELARPGGLLAVKLKELVDRLTAR